MRINTLAGTIGMVMVGAGFTLQPAAAQLTLEQRVEQLEREHARQATQIAEQKQRLEGAPKRVDQLAQVLESDTGRSWFEGIDIGGVIEVEVAYIDPYEGDAESDLALATFELGIASQVNDWVEVAASLLYEGEGTDLEVDLAFLNVYNPDVAPVFLTAGQFYLPFGAYETNLVSDPLTLEIGEARETAAQLGFVYEGFSSSLYAFNGDNPVDGKNRIQSWGANLAYALETDRYTVTAGAGYINDLGDSDTLQDTVSDHRQSAYETLIEDEDPRADQFSTDPTERTGGWTVNLSVQAGEFNFIAEYLSASERFDADSLAYKDKGAEPSAWNLEVGYSFPVMERDSVVALAYQGTREALALELPETSWLVGWSVEIFDRTALSFEYRHDSDYSQRDGGTGEDGSAVVAQLAVEF